jgi:hypothetical protein
MIWVEGRSLDWLVGYHWAAGAKGCTHASRTHRSQAGLIYRVVKSQHCDYIARCLFLSSDSTFIVVMDALIGGSDKVTVWRRIAEHVSSRRPCCLEPVEVEKEQSGGCIVTAISNGVLVSIFFYARRCFLLRRLVFSCPTAYDSPISTTTTTPYEIPPSSAPMQELHKRFLHRLWLKADVAPFRPHPSLSSPLTALFTGPKSCVCFFATLWGPVSLLCNADFQSTTNRLPQSICDTAIYIVGYGHGRSSAQSGRHGHNVSSHNHQFVVAHEFCSSIVDDKEMEMVKG